MTLYKKSSNSSTPFKIVTKSVFSHDASNISVSHIPLVSRSETNKIPCSLFINLRCAITTLPFVPSTATTTNASSYTSVNSPTFSVATKDARSST